MGRVRTSWVAWSMALLSVGLAVAGGLSQLTVRAGGRLVAGADPRFALAYPLADLVLLAVYADSVRRRRAGAALTWKGRTYPPR